MKALIHLDQNGKKVMERRVHDAVMKERADISTRAQYVWALSMLQCGLPPCTVQRVSDHFEAVLDGDDELLNIVPDNIKEAMRYES